MRHALLILMALMTWIPVSAREANEQYRQLLTAISYQGITIGDPIQSAISKAGFIPPFLINFCTRKNLGAPFDPDTEMMFIYSPHGGRILGVRYTVTKVTPAAIAAVEAIKSKIEAIYKVTLSLDAKDETGKAGIEKDGVVMGWTTLQNDPSRTQRELYVYDITLHDELRAPAEAAPKKMTLPIDWNRNDLVR